MLTSAAYRRVVAAFAWVTLSAALPACKDATSPGGIVGSYSLQMVNGASLPFVSFSDGVLTERVTGSTLTLASNSTFTIAINFSETEGSNTSTFNVNGSGTFAVNGSSITFTDGQDGSTVPGTVGGSTLTLTIDSDTWIFAKSSP